MFRPDMGVGVLIEAFTRTGFTGSDIMHAQKAQTISRNKFQKLERSAMVN
jgi:hypothetical protein